MKNQKYHTYLFLILLVIFYSILNYQYILFLKPQGIHFIRQTDGLSFVMNYYKGGFHFFEPQVYNLRSLDGKAACEFPILYYLTALLYFVFDEHEYFLRLITLLIASLGFVYLFKTILLLLKDSIYAFIFTFIFLSSTVLLYYTNNFLPDASAFGLVLIGWYFFFKFNLLEKKTRFLVISFAFFALASLLKITSFINPIAAFIALLCYDYMESKQLKFFMKRNLKTILLFGSALLLVCCWNAYVKYYNIASNDLYFLTKPLPLWSLNGSQQAEVWDHISNYWYSQYYYQSTFHFFIIIILLGMLFLNKVNRRLMIPTLFLGLGSISFFLLFFKQFQDHDYYFITLLPGLILLILTCFIAIQQRFTVIINHWLVKIVLLLLCILSLNYSREKLAQRYANKTDQISNIGSKLAETKQDLDALGVPEKAKIILMSDKSRNGGLYFIHRQGWNLPDKTDRDLKEMDYFVKHGASYLIIIDKIYVPSTEKWIKMSDKRGVAIFKLNKINS